MQYNRLGPSGTIVSKLCLGTMNFGMVTDQKDAFRIMDMALDYGINFFDTSNSYGGYESRGLTERIIGEWFNKSCKRNRVFLGDKVYYVSEKTFFDPNDESGLSAYKIRRHLEESLKRLQTDHVDLYQMHHIDHNANWTEIWSEINRLYYKGDIVYCGSSNFSAYDLAVCNSVAKSYNMLGLVSEQHRYNLLCRLPELEVIPACGKENIGLLVWGPLCAGRLGDHPFDTSDKTRGSHNDFTETMKIQIEKYLIFCRENGINPAQLSLAWILNNPLVTSVIIGPRTSEQLVSCIESLDIDVTDYVDELNRIFPGPGGSAPEVYAW